MLFRSDNFGWNECRFDEKENRWLISGANTSVAWGTTGSGVIYSLDYRRAGSGVIAESGNTASGSLLFSNNYKLSWGGADTSGDAVRLPTASLSGTTLTLNF